MATGNRFLGDSPFRVFLKLLVISFLVGVVMNAFGWSPLDLVEQVRRMVLDLWNMGFSAIERFAGYIALGAVIVVPLFLLVRLATYRR